MKVPRARRITELSEGLLHQLNGYALAASAAGVGVIALAHAAEARIVYTPTHITTPQNSSYYLDVNHDGIYDFRIFNYSSCGQSSCWPETPTISTLAGSARVRHDFNLRSQGVEGQFSS
jgi:hypothetical protein